MENKGFPDTEAGRNFAPEKQSSPTGRQEMKIVRKERRSTVAIAFERLIMARCTFVRQRAAKPTKAPCPGAGKEAYSEVVSKD
ncbi:hypothetical protein CS549_10235 [Porphyromonas gingivalis]|nr:hypothetical protein CS549_10235 [Porphyromonas gingivalis]PDP66022.1 hypothetical protein CLI78_06710 [Porphyromonas gingivalis]